MFKNNRWDESKGSQNLAKDYCLLFIPEVAQLLEKTSVSERKIELNRFASTVTAVLHRCRIIEIFHFAFCAKKGHPNERQPLILHDLIFI